MLVTNATPTSSTVFSNIWASSLGILTSSGYIDNAGVVSNIVSIKAIFIAAASGTVSPYFSQKVASGVSSVLEHSYMKVTRIA